MTKQERGYLLLVSASLLGLIVLLFSVKISPASTPPQNQGYGA